LGFDISPEAVESAKKAAGERLLSTATFVQADIAELPDSFGLFDMIIGRRVLMCQSSAARSIACLLPFCCVSSGV
jgi:2-polyprenyl-3-methyl-5-hydroxy-6-metoxy-1,4-benzoquinol methylase